MGLLSHSKDSTSPNSSSIAPGSNTGTGTGTAYGQQYDSTTGRGPTQGSQAFGNNANQDVNAPVQSDTNRPHGAERRSEAQQAGWSSGNRNQNQDLHTGGVSGSGAAVESGGHTWTAQELEQHKRAKEAELEKLTQQHATIVDAERLEKEAQQKRKDADQLAQGNFSANEGRRF